MRFYNPFDYSDEPTLFPDYESMCISCDTVNYENMTLDELQEMENELKDTLLDWECIIDIELNSSFCDADSLANDRRQAQRTRVELRIIKKRIKMMMNNSIERETSVA